MSRPSRRHFIQAAGAVASAPATAQQADAFAPASALRKLSDNLFLFEDTCNVYVIRDGSSCVLIDFGSGAVLKHLPEAGISKVEWILHTHHHRDQCQGDRKAVAKGIPIAVPAHEHHLFADAENFWRNRRVFHLYYMRNDFNTITRNIKVEKALTDYSTFRWHNIDFFILPTPGHTLGSITLVATVDGRKAAFSGDLMLAPGKLLNLFDTQVNYGGSEGVDLGIYSLGRLREQKPVLLAPSHGEPLNDPDGAMGETMRRLTDYYRFQAGAEPVEMARPYAVSPHFIAHYRTTSSFYAIISDSGKALFIDYGAASGVHFGTFERATATTDRIRFVEHSINELKRTYGMKSIDVAMPSHMHDDHMNGFPHLIRHYGVKVWCYENMVDIFQNPRGHNLGCTLGEPFQVSRSFRNGEKFRWEEFEFEITHNPGHTEYQMALFTTIDGNRIAFTGDAFFPSNEGYMRHNLIFRNHVENDSHLKSIRTLMTHEPTMIAPGHGKPYPVTRELMLATEQRFRKQQQLFFDLLPEGEVDFGLDPSWVSIYPYQILTSPGKTETLEIRVKNYKPTAIKMEVALVTPPEWKIEPDVLKFEAPAKGHAHATARVTIPRGWQSPSPRLGRAAGRGRGGE